ncbi:MAG: hypothetical protein HC925_05790 [Coleofasciculaceae cyanobacterium SM2_3_26]|nr:hypothetical protein [Coleofasciculaceae cyanobacterium SM2_3_26]
MELTFLTKDRQEILLEGSLNCRLEGDRPVSTRAIFRDISDRKRAEANIALQLQRQEALGAIVQQIRESLDISKILATVTQQV